MASNERKFMGDLDHHISNMIKTRLRENPTYFTDRITALEILPYLESVIRPSATREHIQCENNNRGNTYAVRELIVQMKKFQDFAFSFLKGLHSTGHSNIAEDLISGFNIEPHSNNVHAPFIKGLLGLSSSPPPYPLPSSEPIHDQHKKLSYYNSIRNSPTSSLTTIDNGEMSTIRDSELSLSTDSSVAATSMPIDPPPYVDSGPSLFPNIRSSSTNPNNIRSTIQHEETGPQVPFDETAMTRQSTLSDIHESEYCFSVDSINGTTPKEVGSSTQPAYNDYEGGSERLDALSPNVVSHPSSDEPVTKMLNESDTPTQYEQVERIIADPPPNLKTCSPSRLKDTKDFIPILKDDASSQEAFSAKNYLWEIGIFLIAAMSVAAFLLKRR